MHKGYDYVDINFYTNFVPPHTHAWIYLSYLNPLKFMPQNNDPTNPLSILKAFTHI